MVKLIGHFEYPAYCHTNIKDLALPRSVMEKHPHALSILVSMALFIQLFVMHLLNSSLLLYHCYYCAFTIITY